MVIARATNARLSSSPTVVRMQRLLSTKIWPHASSSFRTSWLSTVAVTRSSPTLSRRTQNASRFRTTFPHLPTSITGVLSPLSRHMKPSSSIRRVRPFELGWLVFSALTPSRPGGTEPRMPQPPPPTSAPGGHTCPYGTRRNCPSREIEHGRHIHNTEECLRADAAGSRAGTHSCVFELWRMA
jgi:hypothetical protein